MPGLPMREQTVKSTTANRAAARGARLGLLGHGRVRSFGLKSISVVVALAIWTLISSFFPPSLVPGPVPVAEAIWHIAWNQDLVVHMYHTVYRVVIGYVIALSFSVLIGVIMGVNRDLEELFDVYVLVGLTIPGLIWAIMALMWFGVTELAPVFAIFVVTAPLITMNVWKGTRAVEKELLEMAKAFKASRATIIREVIIPQLLPYIFAATRYGFGLAWKVVVISEMLGLSYGIGFMISKSYLLFQVKFVLAWAISFTIVMFIIEFGLFKPLENRFLAWHPEIKL